MKTLFFPLLTPAISLLIIFASFNSIKAQDLNPIDSLTIEIMETYNVKGIGIVGVHEDSIVIMKGFGHINNANPFSKDSYLYIASNTKAFVGLAIAKLIYEQKIKLSDSITEYITENHFPDSINVSGITVKDLLTHTTGLSNDPMIFRTAYSGEYPSDLTKLLKFSYPINDSQDNSFKYSNYGYLLAGIIIEQVTGKHWKTYLEEDILSVLGMNHTTAHIPYDSVKVAKPYSYKNKQKPLKSEKTEETLHAAGGMFSTLEDMGNFLKFYTNDTSEVPFLYTTKKTLINYDARMGPFEQNGYGYGWIFGALADEKIVYHFGSFPGYESFMAYMPEQNIGTFVFVNEAKGGQRVAAQLAIYFLNSYLDKPYTEQFNDRIGSMVEASYNESKNSLEDFYDAENPDKLEGTFISDKYGTLAIKKSSAGLVVKLGKMSSLAYQGKDENEILVEWTPGIIEHLYVEENKKGQIIIKYGDFDVFRRY